MSPLTPVFTSLGMPPDQAEALALQLEQHHAGEVRQQQLAQNMQQVEPGSGSSTEPAISPLDFAMAGPKLLRGAMSLGGDAVKAGGSALEHLALPVENGGLGGAGSRAGWVRVPGATPSPAKATPMMQQIAAQDSQRLAQTQMADRLAGNSAATDQTIQALINTGRAETAASGARASGQLGHQIDQQANEAAARLRNPAPVQSQPSAFSPVEETPVSPQPAGAPPAPPVAPESTAAAQMDTAAKPPLSVKPSAPMKLSTAGILATLGGLGANKTGEMAGEQAYPTPPTWNPSPNSPQSLLAGAPTSMDKWLQANGSGGSGSGFGPSLASENGNVPPAGNAQDEVDPFKDSESDAQAGMPPGSGMPSPQPKSSLESIIAMMQGQGQGQPQGGATSSTDPHLMQLLQSALQPQAAPNRSVKDRIVDFLGGVSDITAGRPVNYYKAESQKNEQRLANAQLTPQQQFAMSMLQHAMERSGNLQDRKSMVDYSNGGMDPQRAHIVQMLNEERTHGRDFAERERLQSNSAETILARAQIMAQSHAPARAQRTLVQEMAKSHPELFTSDQLQQILGTSVNPQGLQAILQGKSGTPYSADEMAKIIAAGRGQQAPAATSSNSPSTLNYRH